MSQSDCFNSATNQGVCMTLNHLTSLDLISHLGKKGN